MIKAYGITDASAHEVSEILDELGILHTIIGGKPVRPFEICEIKTGVMIYDTTVYVISGIRNIHRITPATKHAIYFVCCSQTTLEESNLSDALSPESRSMDLQHAIHAALFSKFESEWKLEIRQPALLDFVKMAVKPMFVNQLQKLVQSITPYAKSKEARSLCVSYLCGETSREEMLTHLTGSLKFSAIAELMRTEKASQLRVAIGEYKSNTKPLERICEQYGFESFEILYPVNSNSAGDAEEED
jgi:hypothetical protein